MKLKIEERNFMEANKGYSSAVYKALDDDFKDDWSGKVDPVYVSDQVELWLMNDKPCYDNIFNNRMKAHSVAYSAMLSLFQDVVDRYDVKVRVTSEMAKQWLKKNGMNYIDVLKPVVDRVEEERAERKAETKESFKNRKSSKSICEGAKFASLDRKAIKLYDAQDYNGFSAFSDDDLAKLASMCFITQDNLWGKAYDDEVFDAIECRPNKDEIMAKAEQYAGLNESRSRKNRMRKGLKEEAYPFESKRDSSFPYFYVLTHGFGPGTIPRGVHVGRVEDYKGYTVVWLDRPLSSDELRQYDIPSETMLRKYLGNDIDYFRSLSGLPEGIQRKISTRKIKESPDYSSWKETPFSLFYDGEKHTMSKYTKRDLGGHPMIVLPQYNFNTDTLYWVTFVDGENVGEKFINSGEAIEYADNYYRYSDDFNGYYECKRLSRKKRSIKESTWTAPNGKKYGKQKRSHGYSRYIFTRKELKDMIDSGLAQEIRDAEKAWKMSKDVIGYSWNDTMGHKTGILFTDKDGNLWVGNTGVAQMFL